VIAGAGAHQAQVVDVDGDGRLDILAGDENADRAGDGRSGVIRWWRNTTEKGSGPTPPPSEAPPTGNLAPNADLEGDPEGVYVTNGPGAFSWADDAARSGSRSLRIDAERAQPSEFQLSRWMSRDDGIAVSPGATYDVAVFVRTADLQREAGIAVSFFAGSRFLDSVPGRTVSETPDWTELAMRVTAPPAATSMRVEFRLYKGGTLWVDDVSVVASG
jgi:hypothetical protein